MVDNSTKSYETRCLEALSLARAYIRREAPYYSSIIYGLIPHFQEGLETLGVTAGMVMLIDPVWYVDMVKETGHIKTMDKDEATYKMQAGVLVHEAGHILRGIERLDSLIQVGVPKDIVNKGFDIPINDDAKDSGWLLPNWAIYSSTYGFPPNLTGEQYVELLLNMKEEAPNKYKAICEKFGGSSGKVGAGKCGSCGGNGDSSLESKVDAEIGRTGADKQRIRKEAVAQAREAAAQGRGKVPGFLKQLLEDDNRKSVVPWRSRLRSVIRRCSGRVLSGRADFSLRRPSKRSYSRGIVRPGMIDRKPEIMLVRDSSGSMGPDQILSVNAEIKGILGQLGIEDAWFIDADAAVAITPRRIRMRDIHSLPVYGGGGTSFCPAIELAQTLNPTPDILIYLTDGDGAAPKHAPKNMKVIWCIIPTGYGRRPALWGDLVIVSDDQELLAPYEIELD